MAASRKRTTKKATTRKRSGVTPATVKRLCMAMPGAEEGTSYGTPAWKVKGKLFLRLHPDGENVVVKVDFDERDFLTRAKPRVFHFTDHYEGYEMMLVRMAAATEAQLRERIEVSWRRSAPRRLLAQYDEEAGR